MPLAAVIGCEAPGWLRGFWARHAAAESRLRAWFQVVEAADWSGWDDLRRAYPSADRVGRLTVFNLGGNAYRLVARVEYDKHRVYIRSVMTHQEYDEDEWKNDRWF